MHFRTLDETGMTVLQLLVAGYYQVSNMHRIVARLPVGVCGVDALAVAWGDRKRAKQLGETRAGDQFLRVYSRDQIQLTREQWAEFKAAGGGTYDRFLHVD